MRYFVRHCPLHRAAPELLKALKEAAEHQFNPFEPDNQSEKYERWAAVVVKAEGH
jgi:hypothetical protein